MSLLAGRQLLVTGVLTERSIAYRVAELAITEGADVVLTSFGRAMSLTQRMARRLPGEPPVVELDVTDAEHLQSLADRLPVDHLDGVLHSIGFAPPAALGQGLLDTPWSDVATTLQASTWSFPALLRACSPLLSTGASYVGLDFDSRRAWPAYDWMGVAKAGLESACRYLAAELGPRGVRVNLVAAGPLATMAARSVPGFADVQQIWDDRAPLGWDTRDSTPVAQACLMLLSDWFPATTGSLLHVDGGVHAVGR